MIGSGKSDLVDASCCELLVNAIKNSDFVLAIDSRGQIRAEYDKYLGKDHACLAMQLLTLLAKHGRIVKYEWDTRTWNSFRAALKKHRFHSNDYKFVRTAAATECKRLVAQEKGYTNAVCKTIKNKSGVIVESANEAVGSI